MKSNEIRLPNYIPTGYSLWTVVQGAEAAGFGFIASDDQYSVTYSRGMMPDEKGSALTIFKGPPGAKTLAATDGHPGEEADLGVPDVTATYHSGMWVLGSGPQQRKVGRRMLHWDQNSVHSVTIHAPSGIWGVRGPKDSAIQKSELMRVAASLFT